MNETLRELAHHVQASKADIVDRWRRACEADGEMALVSRLTREQFRNNMSVAIDELCAALIADAEAPQAHGIEQEVAQHGHHRWKQGFNLRQLIRDLGHFNQVLVELVDWFFAGRGAEEAPSRSLALHRLTGYMTEAASGSVRRFDELKQAQAASLTEDLETLHQDFEQLTKARGVLLREAVHDLRGSLSAVTTASDLLKLSADGHPSLSQVLDGMDRSLQTISAMLESLLDLSRLEAGADPAQLLVVDVADLLTELAEQHFSSAASKGLTLLWDGPAPLLVRTDPGKVRRIAQNLLVNALQHTRRGEVHLSWASQTTYWTLEVADTGPGIQAKTGSPLTRELNDSELGQRPPPPKTTLSYTGEGIGLSIVKRLCDVLDAGISMESELGKGTRFRVELPLEDAAG